jgi:ABC-type taurine transport system ATPase subunit
MSGRRGSEACRVVGLELHSVVVAGLPRPVDLAVRPGTVAAVVVPEPAAVGWLADVVVGLAEPVAGRVLLDGRERPRPRAGRGSPVALVPADGGLLPNLTVQDNIAYGRRVGEGLSAEQVRGRVRGMAAELGLLDLLDRYPHEITAGRRLRVGLARALLRAPSAVVLEDRADRPSWAAQLPRRDPLDGVAVLVVTDTAARVDGFADRRVEWDTDGFVAVAAVPPGGGEPAPGGDDRPPADAGADR